MTFRLYLFLYFLKILSESSFTFDILLVDRNYLIYFKIFYDFFNFFFGLFDYSGIYALKC